MKRLTSFAITGFLLAASAVATWADDPTSRYVSLAPIPSSLPAGASGNAVQFEVWDQISGGTQISTEGHAVDTDGSSRITNDTGFPDVLLGRPGGLNPANYPPGLSRYLDVTQGGSTVLAARIPLYASPFTVSPGPQGPQGPPGVQGPQGPPGPVASVTAADGSIAIAGTASNPTVAVAPNGINNGHVADGTLSPNKITGIAATLGANSFSGSQNTNATADSGAAVFGFNNATSGFAVGVQGGTNSAGGAGLYGFNNATSGFAVGVQGGTNSPAGIAVSGFNGASSGFAVGVQGGTNSSGGAGVNGYNAATSGSAVGVQGGTNSPTGIAVNGFNGASTGFALGVQGATNSTAGVGVNGFNNATSGFAVGVQGATNSTGGVGVNGFNNASSGFAVGVQGGTNSPTAAGVFGVVNMNNASGASGVTGQCTSTSGICDGVVGQVINTIGEAVLGVYSGPSQSTGGGNGVHGIATPTSGTSHGVVGETSSPDGGGVIGLNNSSGGQGVRGGSNGQNGTGVSGYNTATSGITYGVLGTANSPSGAGVAGFNGAMTGTAIGVNGGTNSPDGVGVNGFNNGGGLAGNFNGGVQINGNLNVTGTVSKGGGSFKIDHPLDPADKYLYHSFVESPDMMNIYNGNVVTDNNGDAVIELPGYFEALNRDFRYQLTVIGVFAQAIVTRKVEDNQFAIKTNRPNVEVSWQVTGVRKDPYAEKHRIPVEEEKPEHERGKYLYPELYGQPDTVSLSRSYGPPSR